MLKKEFRYQIKKMNQVKMIWDFRGPNAEPIARHHEIHLKEFMENEKVLEAFTGIEFVSEFYSIAYMVVPQEAVTRLRPLLKPHRGQIYTPPETTR